MQSSFDPHRLDHDYRASRLSLSPLEYATAITKSRRRITKATKLMFALAAMLMLGAIGVLIGVR